MRTPAPHRHPEISSVPLASTKSVLDYTSLPLFLRLFLSFLENFRNISPHCVPFGTVVEPVLDFIRPANIEIAFFASNLPSKKIFLAAFRCFPVQFALPFFRKKASPGSSHAPSFNSSYSCLAAHFFQCIDRAFCMYQHLFDVLWTHISSIFILSPWTNVCKHGHTMPKSRWAPQVIAGITLARENFLTPTFHVIFRMALFFFIRFFFSPLVFFLLFSDRLPEFSRLTQLFLQETTRFNHLALSFLTIFSD